MSIDTAEALGAALEAALAGARAILEVYGGTFDVELKQDRSPVTEADRKSQAAILAILARRTPGVPVVSEEAAAATPEVRSAWTEHWLVDPLDGTKEFVARRGEFTVNIALIRERYPVLGLVHVPMDGTVYVGSPEGAWRWTVDGKTPGERVRLPVTRPETAHVTAAVSRSHLDPQTQAYLAALEARGRPVRSVSAGSARKLCVVAEGAADVYPRYAPTMEWDTAAGQAVLESAGGRMVDARTHERFSYNKTSLVNPPFIALAAGRDPGYFLGNLPSRPERGSGDFGS